MSRNPIPKPATVSGTRERGRRDVIPREFPVSWEETSAPCQITGRLGRQRGYYGNVFAVYRRSNLVFSLFGRGFAKYFAREKRIATLRRILRIFAYDPFGKESKIKWSNDRGNNFSPNFFGTSCPIVQDRPRSKKMSWKSLVEKEKDLVESDMKRISLLDRREHT